MTTWVVVTAAFFSSSFCGSGGSGAAPLSPVATTGIGGGSGGGGGGGEGAGCGTGGAVAGSVGVGLVLATMGESRSFATHVTSSIVTLFAGSVCGTAVAIALGIHIG